VPLPAGFTLARAAGERDWRDIAAAEHADMPQFGPFNAWRSRTFRARVERGHGVWSIVRDGDGLLAASAGLFSDGECARFASVLTVERYRRRGLMRALIAALLRESRAPADRTVIVSENESPGEALYRALGFRPFASPRAALLQVAQRNEAGLAPR
jgi:GNAT superfamily N-acetyltransferase